MTRTIDLNCDLGEQADPPAEQLAELLPWLSSVNLVCGVHAGSPQQMRQLVRLCRHYSLHLGAHPGLPDRDTGGRGERPVSADEAYETTLYQLGALQAFVRAAGGQLKHVKPHGALYNLAARNADLADAIAAAVADFDSSLVLVGLAGSEFERAGHTRGLLVRREAFVDRAYTDDGYLVPRHCPGAVLHDPAAAVKQAVSLAIAEEVLTASGARRKVVADTLCLHADTPQAVETARAVHAALIQQGIRIGPR